MPEPHAHPPIIIANWKMNLDGPGAGRLAAEVAGDAAVRGAVRVLLAPPSIYLERVAALLRGGPVGLAAQDLHAEPSGAYTGAVSGPMLRDAGATHVLVGHSERRRHFGEDDAAVAAKMNAARTAGLTPVLCIGEDSAERDSGRAREVVLRQLEAALTGGAGAAEGGIVAYEPVWAIGTGRVAEPGQAAEIHALIRAAAGPGCGVLYGGSVTPANAAALLAEPEIDGLLVGSASLTAGSFLSIVRLAGARPA